MEDNDETVSRDLLRPGRMKGGEARLLVVLLVCMRRCSGIEEGVIFCLRRGSGQRGQA